MLVLYILYVSMYVVVIRCYQKLCGTKLSGCFRIYSYFIQKISLVPVDSSWILRGQCQQTQNKLLLETIRETYNQSDSTPNFRSRVTIGLSGFLLGEKCIQDQS